MSESKMIIKSASGVNFDLTGDIEKAINVAGFASLLNISAASIRTEMCRSGCSPMQAAANVLARKENS